MSTDTAGTATRGSTSTSSTTVPVEVRLVPGLLPAPASPPEQDRPAPPPGPGGPGGPGGADGADGLGAPGAPAADAPVVERLGTPRLSTPPVGTPRVGGYRRPTPGGAPARPRAAPPGPPGAAPGAAPDLDPRQACCMVALGAVEVLAGRRPLAQLARWLTPDVYDALSRRAALTAPGTRVLDTAAGRRDVRRDDDGRSAARRASVRRVRVCRVDEHVVESSVVVAHGDRVRAVAVRLTRASGWWRASALVVG